MPDVKGRAQDMVDRAKGAVGKGGPPLASEVEGRVAAVREALQAFGQGDVDRFISVFHEDVEWVAPKGSNFPGSGTLNGREQIEDKFAGTVRRTYASFGFRPKNYLQTEEEDIVVVLGAFEGEGQGGKIDVPGAQVWEFDGNHAVRVRIYTDSEDFPPPVSEEDEEDEEEARQKKERDEERGDEKPDRGGGRNKGESEHEKGESEAGEGQPRSEARDADGESRDEQPEDEAHEGGHQPKGEQREGKSKEAQSEQA